MLEMCLDRTLGNSKWYGMSKKRKRSQPVASSSPARCSNSHAQSLPHPVISLYYASSHVASLRQYLLRLLPASSKSRRRRIASLKSSGPTDCSAQALADLLDTTLVAVSNESAPAGDQTRRHDWTAWSQSQDRCQSTDTGPACPQSEVGQYHG